MQTQAVEHGRVLRKNARNLQKRTKRSDNLKLGFHLDLYGWNQKFLPLTGQLCNTIETVLLFYSTIRTS